MIWGYRPQMLGESQQQVHEAVGHIAPSQEAESSVAAQLVCLPTLGPQSVDWCCPHLRWALLPPLTQCKKKSLLALTCVKLTKMVLDPVKLTADRNRGINQLQQPRSHSWMKWSELRHNETSSYHSHFSPHYDRDLSKLLIPSNALHFLICKMWLITSMSWDY